MYIYHISDKIVYLYPQNKAYMYLRLIESITTLQKEQGNPSLVSKICNIHKASRFMDVATMQCTRMGFPGPFPNVMIDYLSPTPFIYDE